MGSEGNGAIQSLLASAAQITMTKCDTAAAEDSAAMLTVAAGIRYGKSGIAGLLLAGGVLSDALLASQTAGRLSRAL